MDGFQYASTSDEKFYSSNNSPATKVRLWLWVGLLVGLLISAFTSYSSTGSLAIVAAIMISFGVLMDWILRRQLKPGQALVTLNTIGISSPNFSGKVKIYLWNEINDVSIASVQNHSYLQLNLSEAMGKSAKRSFWSGSTKGSISLSLFSPSDQECLIDSINRRILECRGEQHHSFPFVNDLIVEREFQEKLKSLAPNAWLTYALIGINFAVWGLTVWFGAGVIQVPADKLFTFGGNVAFEVQHGEWWRLLSATFLHSGILHLALNMFGLYATGVTVERIYGHRFFTLIYFGSALMGSAMSLHFSAQKAVSVGASGAVFGVAGALLIAVFRYKQELPKAFSKQTLTGMAFFIGYSLLQGFTQEGIDNAAHVGGLIGGCLLAGILPVRFDMERFHRQLRIRGIVAFAAIFFGIGLLASTAPHAEIDQRKIFANAVLLDQGLKEFDAAITAIKQEQLDIKNGKLTELESDERSRTVHAPMFRKAYADLSQIWLPPTDFREPLLKDATRFSELMAELLGMESVVTDGGSHIQPANVERTKILSVELAEVAARIAKWTANVKSKKG